MILADAECGTRRCGRSHRSATRWGTGHCRTSHKGDPHHLYWPLLDVDLSVRSVRRPADFPLVPTATAALTTGT